MTVRKKFYPWSAALPKNVAVPLATLGKLGDLTAPGTWGSAAGLLFYALVFNHLTFLPYIIFASLLAYIAIGVCDAAERHLQMRDPGRIILDEFVAMPFCFLPIVSSSYSVWGMLLGFAFFRFFDVRKPFFINSLQDLEGGLGCVIDDIAAALCTCICINALALILNIIYV